MSQEQKTAGLNTVAVVAILVILVLALLAIFVLFPQGGPPPEPTSILPLP